MNSHQNFVDSLEIKKMEAGSFNIPEQQALMRSYLPSTETLHIMETGFNAGHSACLFLLWNPNCSVTSYDLGEHRYVSKCRDYLQARFPDRLKVVIGDTRKTLMLRGWPEYDGAFIDGGHSVQVAMHDLRIAVSSVRSGGFIMMDDVVKEPVWIRDYNKGPNVAWQYHLDQGWITEVAYSSWHPGRGMAVGVVT